MTDRSYFVEKLVQRCRDRGTTPYFVALDCSIEPSLMSAIVNGKRKPKPDTWHQLLKKLASSALLGTDLSTLIHWKAIDDYGPDAIRPGASPDELPDGSISLESGGPSSAVSLHALPLKCVLGQVDPKAKTLGEATYQDSLADGASGLSYVEIADETYAPVFSAGGVLIVRATEDLQAGYYYLHEAAEASKSLSLYQLSDKKKTLIQVGKTTTSLAVDSINKASLYQVVEYRKSWDS